MKLVEIAAIHLDEINDDFEFIYQDDNGWVYTDYDVTLFRSELADDWIEAKVTRAQWEAEHARIASNQQATQEAREIAQGDGKRSKEDQALWDRVAIAAIKACADEFGCRNPKDISKLSFDVADEFIAERTKRLRNSHTTSSTT